MTLQELSETLLPAIESELQLYIGLLNETHTKSFYEILAYHMGWTGPAASSDARGKRIRSQLLLLTCAASQGQWKQALPAAAAVECIHNFSLIHDDIQDRSNLRRGRPTVWVKWGIPLAINSGDALFTLANLAALELTSRYKQETICNVLKIIHNSCLDLTRGQHIDIYHENQTDFPIEDYWHMIGLKTAALISACTTIGALLGNASEEALESYRSYGQYLGLAFQVKDDFLGIWGDSALTGKSSESDLLTGKKTFPVLCGLNNNRQFAKRWKEASIKPKEVASLADLLTQEGIKLHTLETIDQMTEMAIAALRTANPQGEAGEALFELTHSLLNRQA